VELNSEVRVRDEQNKKQETLEVLDRRTDGMQKAQNQEPAYAPGSLHHIFSAAGL
jgi:hypothetical protein